MLSLIIVFGYKAILNAMLVVPRLKIPFDNVNEMVSQHQIGWQMVAGTLFLNATKVLKIKTIAKLREMHSQALPFMFPKKKILFQN